MKNTVLILAVLAAGCASTGAPPAGGPTVTVTPLGSHDGEFCVLDRALVFEDPDGTRILYDAGFTVRGANDPRLGKIDAVLLSHVHNDHLGPSHQPAANAGACGKPDFSVTAIPNSNTVNIAVGKGSRLIVGAEMASFFSGKVKAAGGDPGKVQLLRFGASTKVGGVTVSGVPAVHSNGLAPAFLQDDLAKALAANGLTAYLGPPGGYVLQFSNGLSVYLSGDTGITAEQNLVVRRFYKANLAVINIGGTFTTGPVEAAYVINDMVRPNSVIASHANEEATSGGKLKSGTRTETFMKATNVPVYLPLSGRAMKFDRSGTCVAGC